MKYFLLAALLFLVACKKTETDIATTDSTIVTQDARPSSPTVVDTQQVVVTDTNRDVANEGEQGAQLLPVDQASQDPSFAKFRNEMLTAVTARNASALMPMLDSNIRLSFGGSGGLADFRKNWKPQDKNSALWTKLEWVVKHGGSFRKEGANTTFWAPYVYSNWPDSGPDGFEYAVATGSDVLVYAKPDTTSKVISHLDYHYVKSLDGGQLKEKAPRFTKVQTASGKTGYVKTGEIRSQIDYRAGFSRRNGTWKLTAFIAGD